MRYEPVLTAKATANGPNVPMAPIVPFTGAGGPEYPMACKAARARVSAEAAALLLQQWDDHAPMHVLEQP